MWIVNKIKSGDIYIEKDDEKALRLCLRLIWPDDNDNVNERAIKDYKYFHHLMGPMWGVHEEGDYKGLTIKASELWDELRGVSMTLHGNTTVTLDKDGDVGPTGFPFEKRDWITVTRRPSWWSAHLNTNSPIFSANPEELPDFPFTGQLKDFESIGPLPSGEDFIAMDMGGYGWEYNPDIMRKAAPEEISYAKYGLKEGDLCFVRWHIEADWHLKYFAKLNDSHEPLFQITQLNKSAVMKAPIFKKANGVKLPK